MTGGGTRERTVVLAEGKTRVRGMGAVPKTRRGGRKARAGRWAQQARRDRGRGGGQNCGGHQRERSCDEAGWRCPCVSAMQRGANPYEDPVGLTVTMRTIAGQSRRDLGLGWRGGRSRREGGGRRQRRPRLGEAGMAVAIGEQAVVAQLHEV